MPDPDFDDEVVLWVADANGDALPLVELGAVPLDGTWEVLCGGVESGFDWAPVTGKFRPFVAAEGDSTVLVVARPIGGV